MVGIEKTCSVSYSTGHGYGDAVEFQNGALRRIVYYQRARGLGQGRQRVIDRGC